MELKVGLKLHFSN